MGDKAVRQPRTPRSRKIDMSRAARPYTCAGSQISLHSLTLRFISAALMKRSVRQAGRRVHSFGLLGSKLRRLLSTAGSLIARTTVWAGVRRGYRCGSRGQSAPPWWRRGRGVCLARRFQGSVGLRGAVAGIPLAPRAEALLGYLLVSDHARPRDLRIPPGAGPIALRRLRSQRPRHRGSAFPASDRAGREDPQAHPGLSPAHRPGAGDR
jgi:hypothetical protein